MVGAVFGVRLLSFDLVVVVLFFFVLVGFVDGFCGVFELFLSVCVCFLGFCAFFCV